MGEHVKPTHVDQALDLVRWAIAEEKPLELVSGGTKRKLGRPLQVEHTLDFSALTGVQLYEPEELVLSAKPGTPLAEVESLLAKNKQQLAFEPPDYGSLLGAAGAPTVGGIIGCNLAGPRRIKAGAARDHLLGVHAISGRGDVFKTGGRVVKNVTGYDLPKLLCGSYGTLAVMTEVILKVLPAPEEVRTVLLLGLDDLAATNALSEALGSPYEVSGAAHLPPPVAARSAVEQVRCASTSVTCIRVEGVGPSVAYRAESLRGIIGRRGASVPELDTLASEALWREIRDVRPFAVEQDRPVWKILVPPDVGAQVVARIEARQPSSEAYYDWGGGLIWLMTPVQDDACAEVVRDAVGGHGHATLIRAPDTVRIAQSVFQPQPAPLAALTMRVKEGFDPKRILNPGRMYSGV